MSIATPEANLQLLERAVELGKDGMFLDALEPLRSCGPLRDWSGAARVDVAWIVAELGAPRLSRWHTLKAYREAPESLRVRTAYCQLIAEENGPYDALEFAEAAQPLTGNEPADEQLRWLWLQASSLTSLRDFSEAESWLEKMEAIKARPEITLFSRAFWLERQDRYDEALAAITDAFNIRAVRSTIGYRAQLLTLVGQDDAANELLREYDQKKQIASFSWQMTAMAYERRDYPECSRLLERFESLSPLLERAFGERFTMFRCELARRAGDDEKAIEYARRSKSAYGNTTADRLADPTRKDRIDKVLPVEFVRQHELTCGPATLSAISRFWGRDAEHLEVAEEICYNGTTNHAERQWASQNGYYTREFTVTEPVTEALIERDVPFTLVTRGAGYAHLQSVIGYDGRMGRILIRDPYQRVRGSAPADELLESQAAFGPRGMVLVPEDRRQLIDGIEFPDSELYDLLHALDGALIRHQRDEAISLMEQIEKAAPEHRLRWQAQRQLATYDGNEQGILTAVQKQIELYPDDVSLQMSELSLLSRLGRDAERVARLRELVAKPKPHPLLKLQLAESLALDGRYRDEAQQLIREAMRGSGSYARNYLELGDLLWQRHDRKTALRLYRFAACLEDKDEFLATRYFDASVSVGQTQEALAWLRERFERFGKLSMQPAITLHNALSRLRRHQESIDVLETAMKLRPDDAELTLAVVRCLATTSSEYWTRAQELLDSVRESAPDRAWHEAASQMAVMRCDWKQGLTHLEHLLPRSPLSMGLREQITELIAQVDGDAAASEHWRAAADEFPHFQPLLERYAISLRDRPLEEVQPVLEKILKENPDNAWAVRELAQHLLSAGKLDEAEKNIALAVELDAEHTFAICLQAALDARKGANDSARTRLRKLLANDISDDYAVSKLLDYCDSVEQQRQELAWVLQQLRCQSVTGDVLSVYRRYAESIVPAEELSRSLREAREARGDLWQAHQSWIRQLTQTQQLDEALQAAEVATEEFPLEPNAWFEKYRVAAAIGDQGIQREALERCRLLRPSNPAVTRALADLFCSEGRFGDAKDLLQSLVSEQPLDAVSRVYLADVLVELDEKEAALEQYIHSVELEPEYDFAWGRLDGIAQELERPNERMEIARRLTQEQPHAVAAWIEYAKALGINEEFTDAHAALDRAEAIDPYRESIHISRARLLVNSGDYRSAMQALQPPIYPTVPPSLEVSRAQMLWDVGQQDEAYELVRKTAEENPAATQIWSHLEHWATLRDDKVQAIAAVEHQMQLQPHDPDVLDSAAHTFVSLDDKSKAIDAFRRAIEINPAYSGSRCSLFDLLIERDQWQEAAEIMTDLPRSDQHPTVIARRMQVSLHNGDHDKVEQDFEAILASDDWSSWAIDQCVDVMTKINKKRELVARVERALRDESSNRDFGRVWVNLTFHDTLVPIKKRLQNIAERIQRLVGGEHRDAGHAALSALMPELTQKERAGDLKRFIKTNEQWLSGDTHCWTLVAYAYADNPNIFRKSRIRHWLQGWRERDDYKPWMLTNVHELCRLTGDLQGGRDAVRMALEMPADHMQSQLRLWSAHDALAEGDWQSAMKHFMAASRLEHLEGYERLLHHWVEAVFHAQQATDKRASFEQLRRHLAELGTTPDFFNQQPVYRPVYEQTVTMIAEAIGTTKAKLWAMAKIARLKLLKIGIT